MSQALLSNSLDLLCEDLAGQLRQSTEFIIGRVIVPSSSIRAWLSHQLTIRGISILRVEILLLSEAISNVLTKEHLLPLLTSFFANQHPELSPLQVLHKAKQNLIPLAWKIFVGGRGCEEFFSDWESWCPLRPGTLSSDALPLFLFGFSSINQEILKQFQRSPSFRKLYILSPCMLFWGDLCSDNEMRRLLTSARERHVAAPSEEQLEALLLDRHRLLANCGHIGREFLLLLEDSNWRTESRYILPTDLATAPYIDYVTHDTVWQQKTSTLLDHLKADLLFLVGKRETVQSLPQDESIELHAAYTPVREVEALLRGLACYQELPPASVLVMATNVQVYRAAFEEVFGGLVSYTFVGGDNPSGPISALRMLFSLISSKGVREDWIQLIRHPFFQTVIGLDGEEAQSLVDWLSKSTISWGLNREYQQRYLDARGICLNQGHNSFFEEEDRWLSMLFQHENSSERLDMAAFGARAKFFSYLHTLAIQDKLPFHEQDLLPLTQWAKVFHDLATPFLVAGGFEEEAIGYALAQCEKIACVTAPMFPWGEAKALFFRLVNEHREKKALDLRTPIIVAELGFFSPFPADVVAILGAQNGSLPQYGSERLLARIERMVPTLPASGAYFDRYAVIEALLAAQKKLIITYQSHDFATRQPISCAAPIMDIFSHLDSHYRIDGALPSEKLIVRHALTRPPRGRKRQADFSNDIVCEEQKSQGKDVDLQRMRTTARSAMEQFFISEYGCRSSWENVESVFIRPWEVKGAFESRAIDTYSAKMALELTTQRKELEEQMQSFGLGTDCYDLHLLPTVFEMRVDEESKVVSSPVISCDNALQISGVWPALRKDGIVLLGSDWKRELFAKWLECVLRAYFRDHFGNQAVLLEEEKILTICLPTPSETVQHFAEFSLLAKTIDFPFTYDTVRLLLKNPSADGLYDAIQAIAERYNGEKSFSPLCKESPAWVLYAKKITPEYCEQKIPLWSSWACKLYSHFFSFLESV